LKTTSDALDIVAHSDFNRNIAPAAEELDQWSSVDPARLIDLLENIDGLKQEVQERMRRVDAVNKAKSLLQEDAIRTEALNRKLAELGKAFGEVRHEPSVAELRGREAELLRMPARETVSEIPVRHSESPSLLHQKPESIHLEKRESHVFADQVHHGSATLALPAAFGQPEDPHEFAVRNREPDEFSATHVTREPIPMTDPHPITAVELVQDFAMPRPAISNPEFHVVPPSHAVPRYQEPSVSAMTTHAEPHVMPSPFGQPSFLEAVNLEVVNPEAAEAFPPPPRHAYRDVAQRFSEASIQKDEARIQPVIEGEPVPETKAVFGDTWIHMEEARQAWTQAQEALLAARHLMEQSSAQLSLSRSKEETSSTDLKSAQQDLTTAYQFAAVAAQRQHDAAEAFRKSKRWALAALAASWMVMAWVAWLPFRAVVPIWGPGVITALIVLIAVLLNRKGDDRE
jgi:hypothetical protein